MRTARGRSTRARAALLVLGVLAWVPTAALELIEPPSLEALVRSGELPPIGERVPSPPAVAVLGEAQSQGEHGGTLNVLMGGQRDLRMMMVYGYARLVGYDPSFRLVPDIVERVDNESDRVFTFHLRKGHRWSDGHSFTAEDFRYYWEDVATNEELSPFGLERELLVDGEAPQFEVIDAHTVRYRWSTPNPYFLPAIAGARPLFIYLPAHYLKRVHARYANREDLQKQVGTASQRNWAGLHHRLARQYRFDNVDLPTLQPWVNTTAPPADRFVFRRNPYYHRIDGAGRQLPYIDEVVINIAENSLIPAKTGFGESDLQSRYIRLDHYTFLKRREPDSGVTVHLWRRLTGSRVALYPNLNVEDPVWRQLLRDVRFRRALSLGINRETINQALYFGLGRPSSNTVLPESPLYKPEYQSAFAAYDVDAANALLDAIGLTERSKGVRLLPDGRRLQIIVDASGESTEESDVLELIKQDWNKLGIELFTKVSQREVFRNRVYAGAAIMSVWSGLENGLPGPDSSPRELAPTDQSQLQWPKWGEYFETSGASGIPPEIEPARRLLELNRAWRVEPSRAGRAEIWHTMLGIHAEEVFCIGVVNGVPQPVVVTKSLRNVPESGIYNWDPGAYFGLYRPDTFWFTAERRQGAR